MSSICFLRIRPLTWSSSLVISVKSAVRCNKRRFLHNWGFGKCKDCSLEAPNYCSYIQEKDRKDVLLLIGNQSALLSGLNCSNILKKVFKWLLAVWFISVLMHGIIYTVDTWLERGWRNSIMVSVSICQVGHPGSVPTSAANWLNIGRAICYHVFVIIHVKDLSVPI